MLICRLLNNGCRRTSSNLSKTFRRHLYNLQIHKPGSTFPYIRQPGQMSQRINDQTTKSAWVNLKRCLRSFSSSTNTNSRPKASSTIDEEDVNRFSALAHHWWRENGEFQALHTLNEIRVPLICDSLKQTVGPNTGGSLAEPLKGFSILDIGSGGGILAEPLARLGATVIGVDASEENIKVAETHAKQDPNVMKNLKYIHGSVEDFVGTEEGKFDAVVASEIVEHVFNAPDFIASCSKLVKPGGSLFLTTINKTYMSYILAVAVAENVLQLVPKGTHDWEKFITPQDLQDHLSQNMMVTRLVHGMCYNPLTYRWTWINDTSVNYAIHAVKQTID